MVFWPGQVPGAGGKRVLGLGQDEAVEEGTGSWRVSEAGDQFFKGGCASVSLKLWLFLSPLSPRAKLQGYP